MFKKTDPNSFTEFINLYNGKVPIGRLTSEFFVTKLDDVQAENVDSVAKPKTRKFLVNVTQKIIIANPSGSNIGPTIPVDPIIPNTSQYLNYPVLVDTSLSVTKDDHLNYELLDFSPKTINTQIQSSGANTSGATGTSSSSKSNTVGSSTTETNSYGASASLEGVSSNYEHSSSHTNDQSATSGSDASNARSKESSDSASMSIKDWGAYAFIDPRNNCPSWRFGQEYPWDAIRFNEIPKGIEPWPTNPNQIAIMIPREQEIRMIDTTGNSNNLLVYPPSQLSLFGVNFVTKSSWQITVNNIGSDDISIAQNIGYFTASHLLMDLETITVFMDQKENTLTDSNGEAVFSTALNLPLMALDPLGKVNHNAIIGFAANKFTVPPSSGVPFKITSTHNNLMILDTTVYPATPDNNEGFSILNNLLNVDFTPNCYQPQITLYFKVIDTTNDYVLHLKNWKSNDVGVALTLTINGDTDNSITSYIDDNEGLGGTNNLLSINLRNQDFASADYNDYLQLGLNSVQISITPIGGKYVNNSGYQIRALSIETANG